MAVTQSEARSEAAVARRSGHGISSGGSLAGRSLRRLKNEMYRRVRHADPRVLSAFAAVYLSGRDRGPCRVTYDEGLWIHRYRDGITVRPTVGGPTARQQDLKTHDVFLFDHRPGPGDTVVDLGAGVGGEVATFSRLVGRTGRVISVEAHPRTAECLRRAVRENGLANVTVVECAGVGESRMVLLEDDEGNHIGNGLTADPLAAVQVQGLSLAEIVEQCQVTRINLLKINIEGAELEVLEGAGDVLDHVDHLTVSCHDFKADDTGNDWRRTYGRVRDLLERSGFIVRTRRDAARPWIDYYLYASRPAVAAAL